MKLKISASEFWSFQGGTTLLLSGSVKRGAGTDVETQERKPLSYWRLVDRHILLLISSKRQWQVSFEILNYSLVFSKGEVIDKSCDDSGEMCLEFMC